MLSWNRAGKYFRMVATIICDFSPGGDELENIIEYVENNMKTFALQDFNAVDSLVLSKLSYFRFEDIVPFLPERGMPVKIGELLKAELFSFMLPDKRDRENSQRLLFALAASPRFRNTYLNFYVNNYDLVAEKQFSSVTFFLEDKTAYIAYRGTDSTFVGWKEDFNMAYISPIPAQEDGVKYLNTVARKIPGVALRVGGHSKGGNIAVYSAVKCDLHIQKRIKRVYNHDGPGFKENLFMSPEFLRIKDIIHTTLPESSLVGMLLQYHEDYLVIKSSRRGFMQHDAFTWIVDNDDFCYAEKISNSALLRSKSLNEWLNSLNDEKRKMFINALFEVLEKTENESFIELTEEWKKAASSILVAIKNSDPETKKFVSATLSELAKLSVKNLFKHKQNS